jgi:gas vesicle protein GvpL/GvpF
MTVRIFGPRRARAPRGTAPAPADSRHAGPGARYLAARRRLHAAATAPELDPIRPLLSDLVADERVHRHGTPPLLASVYHLVPREEGARYRERLARGARELEPFRLTVTGPWPPYAFGADPWP